MVTTVENRVATRKTTLEELGRELGIPIKVRPWWGSMRGQSQLKHLRCRWRGTVVRSNLGLYCFGCGNTVKRKDTERIPATRKWECPGGPNYSQMKRPEVQDGVVIIWEGLCKYHGHTHRQSVKVIDSDIHEQAMILHVTSSTAPSHLLIGMDDEHPFVTPILRRLMTVQDAFDWLVPNKVREALTLGADVKRQGDWFFLPTDKEPRLNNGMARDNPVWGSRPRLLLHSLYHEAHLVYGVQTRHIGEEVVYKAVLGLPYPAPFTRGDVCAPDHPVLHLESWHIGVRTRSTPAGNRDNPGFD